MGAGHQDGDTALRCVRGDPNRNLDPSFRYVTFILTNNGVMTALPRREEGELLFPKLFGPNAIADAKLSMGTDAFSAQHNQEPVPVGGGMFKRTWWRFWKPDGISAPDCPRPNR